jgi:hypothetical protein
MDRKIVSEAFYQHELEEEMKERKIEWTYKGDGEKQKDVAMEYIENLRRNEVYSHPESDCSRLCKDRGMEGTRLSMLVIYTNRISSPI